MELFQCEISWERNKYPIGIPTYYVMKFTDNGFYYSIIFKVILLGPFQFEFNPDKITGISLEYIVQIYQNGIALLKGNEKEEQEINKIEKSLLFNSLHSLQNKNDYINLLIKLRSWLIEFWNTKISNPEAQIKPEFNAVKSAIKHLNQTLSEITGNKW